MVYDVCQDGPSPGRQPPPCPPRRHFEASGALTSPRGLARACPDARGSDRAGGAAAAAGTARRRADAARPCIAFCFTGDVRRGRRARALLCSPAALGTAVNTCRGRPTLGGGGQGTSRGRKCRHCGRNWWRWKRAITF